MLSLFYWKHHKNSRSMFLTQLIGLTIFLYFVFLGPLLISVQSYRVTAFNWTSAHCNGSGSVISQTLGNWLPVPHWSLVAWLRSVVTSSPASFNTTQIQPSWQLTHRYSFTINSFSSIKRIFVNISLWNKPFAFL